MKTKAICIRLPEKIIEYLKKESHLVSVDLGKEVFYTDLVRESIFKAYPILQNIILEDDIDEGNKE